MGGCLGIFVHQLHVVQLLGHWSDYVEEHHPVLSEDLLLQSSWVVRPCHPRVHRIVKDIAELSLIGLEHLHLLLHHPGLLVEQALRNSVGALCLDHLLTHLINEGIHLLVCDLIQLSLVVLHALLRR
jgi:hypothetical protein